MQVSNLVSIAQYDNKAVGYKSVGTYPTILLLIPLLGL